MMIFKVTTRQGGLNGSDFNHYHVAARDAQDAIKKSVKAYIDKKKEVAVKVDLIGSLDVA